MHDPSTDTPPLRRALQRDLPWLRGVARRFARSPGASEDLVQDTLLAALESEARFDPTRPARPWLLTILRHRRSRGLRSHGAMQPSVEELQEVCAPQVGPRAEVEHAELYRIALQSLERLPVGYREVLRMRWLQGLTTDEIGRRLGKSPAAVRVQQHRGMRLWRRESRRVSHGAGQLRRIG